MPQQKPLFSGNFAETPSRVILLKIFTQKLSGTLQVQYGSQKWELGFENGRLVRARSNLVSESLSRLALRYGLIEEKRIFELEAWMEQHPGTPHGEFLRSLNIKEADIQKLLRQQLSQRAARVLLLKEGLFRFIEGPVQKDPDVLSPSLFKIFLDSILLLKTQRPLPPERIELLSGWEAVVPELKEPPLKEWFSPLIKGEKVTPQDLLAHRDPQTRERIHLSLLALRELGLLKERPAETEAVEKAPSFSDDPKLSALFKEFSQKNYFEILGVPENASPSEIKKAYFRLAKEYHPDRHYNPSMKRAHPTAEALFALIVEAYETLMDEEKKKEYLDRLKRGVTAKEEAEMAEKALKAEIEFQKGMVFFRKRQWREASHSFSQAMESNPGEPEFKIYFFWSRFMSLVNSPEEAKKVLLELENLANQLAPPFPRSFYFLGRGYKIVGDFARAHSYLKKARELLPEDLEVRQELRAIERELTDKKPPPSGKIT